MPKILELTVGINGKILPQPANFARKLKALCVGLIKRWHEKFGSTYMQVNYLNNMKKLWFMFGQPILTFRVFFSLVKLGI